MGRTQRRAVVLCVLFVFLAPQVFADFTGPVISVLDGDTIEVLHNRHPSRIRLTGIDCPEKGQAYGNNAKHAASKLVFRKEVSIQTHGKDKYNRTLGDVFLRDGPHVNHMVAKDGWCWWYWKYEPGDTEEGRTRGKKKGLWADPHSLAQWAWGCPIDIPLSSLSVFCPSTRNDWERFSHTMNGKRAA